MTQLPIPLPASLQDLPPKAAHLCLNIERTLRHTFATELKDKHLLLACSSGLDSTALLFMCHYLKKRLSLTLSVAHYNHQTRKACPGDAAYVRHCCAALGVSYHEGSDDVPAYARKQQIGIEEAARTLRYDFLQKIRAEHKADWIVTAHQNDDLAEDIIMRLLRGSGWPGLGGMCARDNGRRLLRPLLLTKRNDLSAFLELLAIPWHHDESNDDQQFLRNRVRKQIMPLLLTENPAFLDTAATLWTLARIDASHWEQETALLFAEQLHPMQRASRNSPCHVEECDCAEHASPPAAEEESIVLSKALLAPRSAAQRLRAYKKALELLGKGQPQAAALLQLDTAWQKNNGGTTIQFSGNKTGTVQQGGIIFKRVK